MRFLFLLLVAALPVLGAPGQDSVQAKLKALFTQFDADHNGILTQEEQSKALEFVKSKYGKDWATRVEGLFASEAGKDKTLTQTRWDRAIDAQGGGATPPAIAAEAKTVFIPMRDGKKLATDIFLPKGDGPFPVVLSRTPYGRKKMEREGLAFPGAGIVYIMQDMRGRFESEGENLPFVGCGWGDHQDGIDTIEWIKKQTWCNGLIGTAGGSAGGITQNLLAGAEPKGIVTQHISVAAANMYLDASYIGGAFRKADVEGWLGNNQFETDAIEAMRAHPSYDNYWRTMDTSLKYSVMDIPAVHIGGWFDMFAQATIDEYVGRQHLGKSGSRGKQKLVMGPWTHSTGKTPAGELSFPKAGVPRPYTMGPWFQHYLLGMDNGVDREPAVAYYVMGDTKTPGAPGNEWRYADDWPIPSTSTAVYLNANHTLSMSKQTETASTHLDFVFDPANPCPTVGGNNLTIPRGSFNQNKIEDRGDVVLFTSEPLDTPIEVTGRVSAKIYVASSAKDTDVSLRICDVYPDGKSYLIVEGIRRLRYRNGFEKPELLTPGKVEEVNIDCWSTSMIFNKGHRIRATITSSNYPRFDINPGTGEPFAEHGTTVKQANEIFCDASHASCLLLPVVSAKAK